MSDASKPVEVEPVVVEEPAEKVVC